MAGYLVTAFEYPPVATDDSIQDVVAYYVDNEDEQILGAMLQGLASGILVI